MSTDEDGHVLISLWKDYAAASDADRPRQVEEILDKILEESKAEDYLWDYYCAASRWPAAVSSRNWKLRDEAVQRIESDLNDIDSPLLTYSVIRFCGYPFSSIMVDSVWFNANVVSRSEELRQTCRSTPFNKLEALDIHSFILGDIRSDYEFLLWTAWTGGNEPIRRIAGDLLRGEFSTYPKAQYIELRELLTRYPYKSKDDEAIDARRAALEAFSQRNGGTAIALLSDRQLIFDRKRTLDDSSEAASGDYTALRAACVELMERCGTFEGDEATIAASVDDMEQFLESLDAPAVNLSIENGRAEVLVRNLAGVELQVLRGTETVAEAGLKNNHNSYYVIDTLHYDLPELPDTTYKVRCFSDTTEASVTYKVRSVSLARRTIGSGVGIYIADYLTGRPIEKADLQIGIPGKGVQKTLKDFEFNGFTQIQDILRGVVTGSSRRVYVKCSYIDDRGFYRESDEVTFSVSGNGSVSSASSQLTGKIFPDRSAFNPGDTLQFKAVIFSVLPDGDLSLASEGTVFKVTLTDPDGKAVQSLELSANDFGSIAGSMEIPSDARGGTYRLKVNDGDETVVTSSLTVDEFVLPTFTMEFQPQEQPYYSGDTVSVKGCLTSYSGHSLSSAEITYKVNSYSGGLKTIEGKVEAASDGSFDIRFVAGADSVTGAYYYLSIVATDLTGETCEWSRTVRINPRHYFSIDVSDKTDGRIKFSDTKSASGFLTGDRVSVKFDFYIQALSLRPEINVRYVVKSQDRKLMSGSTVSGLENELSFVGQPGGVYVLEAEADYLSPTGHSEHLSATYTFLKISDSDTSVPRGVEWFCRKIEDGRIAAQVGVSERTWFVVEVYDAAAGLLHSELLELGGAAGEVVLLDYPFVESNPDGVRMNIFCFKDGSSRCETYVYEPQVEDALALPLTFTSFTDYTLPRTECSFTLQTSPDVEAVVSVFDKSTERIRTNLWTSRSQGRKGVRSVYITSSCGQRRAGGYSRWPSAYYGEGLALGEGNDGVVTLLSPQLMVKSASATSSTAATLSANSALSRTSDEVVPDAAVSGKSEAMAEDAAEETGNEEVAVREQFDNTLAFLPFLRSDRSGNISFSVTPTDKLSTYYVSVFAHDRQMHNGVLRREIVVTNPLKVSVVQPQFLYEGDVYRTRISVSNSAETACSGDLILRVFDTEDYREGAPIATFERAMQVNGGSANDAEFEVRIPKGISVLGMKATLLGEDASDAVFVSIPVREPVQTLSESHSALFLPGMDADSLRTALAAAFVNVPAREAEYKEISLLDLIRDAIPEIISTEGKDILSRSEAFAASLLARSLREHRGDDSATDTADASGLSALADTSAAAPGHPIPAAEISPEQLLKLIIGARNNDGGFGWYEGFSSSEAITAVVLERFARLRDRGLLSEEWQETLSECLSGAVKYLDNSRLSARIPVWCGGISLEQYLYVRTMYPDVAFSPSRPSDLSEADYTKALNSFKEEVGDYLLPDGKRGLQGNILGKARRVACCIALSDNKDLADALGLKSSSKSLFKSAAADIISLKEYAVEHSSGGIYFPNAVMPFRGLLESEAYAHMLLCDLMHGWYVRTGGEKYHRVAEGIRLWLMVQKESQEWDSDGEAYADVLRCVLDGSPETLSSRVAVMTATFSKPFGEILASGNGFTVTRRFYRYALDSDGRTSRLEEIKTGEILNVGDKIVAQYTIWNEENRSFVRLETPRYASLRPVVQLSGASRGLLRSVSLSGSPVYWFTPYTYREVKADRTIWNFDVCPEETTIVSEEFFVTQAGEFTSPAVSVESLYAPHYRANDSSAPILLSE